MPRENYNKQIFEILSKGHFISSNSINSTQKKLYQYLEKEKEATQDYFDQIGFYLVEGKDCFYFSREEEKSTLKSKLERAMRWISILDFFKSYDESFGVGTQITPSEISSIIGVNQNLKNKLNLLKRITKKEKYDESVNELFEILKKEGFVEVIDDLSMTYKVLNSFSYLEELILSIDIEEPTTNEN
ncbi:hypothetical protein [Flammeovirga sp. SJP92]|uniref:condensin complex protein MksE n=1 Tax=Flammeovirga sp. SJP92 TaxID=1775430 RepID=UPI0007891DB9|nr:hypothetical protein [Flammeovirga sp. SJP92]KXX72619.1 hypothetical protein AVL50_06350 [Flammeovirga sp. SJP92]